jgi:hypothetical protein
MEGGFSEVCGYKLRPLTSYPNALDRLHAPIRPILTPTRPRTGVPTLPEVEINDMGRELRLFALDVHRLKSVKYKGGCFAGAPPDRIQRRAGQVAWAQHGWGIMHSKD